jgi:hypothetical protein
MSASPDVSIEAYLDEPVATDDPEDIFDEGLDSLFNDLPEDEFDDQNSDESNEPELTKKNTP